MMKTWTYSFPQRIGIAGSKDKTSAEAPIDMPDDGQNWMERDLYQENPEDGWELIEPPAE